MVLNIFVYNFGRVLIFEGGGAYLISLPLGGGAYSRGLLFEGCLFKGFLIQGAPIRGQAFKHQFKEFYLSCRTHPCDNQL